MSRYKNNYVLGFEIAPGNTHDSISFPKLYNKLIETYLEVESVVVDSEYRTLAIARLILEIEKIPVMPYKKTMTKEGFLKKHDYVYDEYNDFLLSPNYNFLKYGTTNPGVIKSIKVVIRIVKITLILNNVPIVRIV